MDKNNKRKVSIAMATYNGSRYLREQLDSLYAQTRVPDEIIVCDDNSTDGTIEILEEYRTKYGLKYYVNNPGLGVNGNFYKAIGLTTCEYICICDQDDIWYPHKIETLYNKLIEIDDGMPSLVSSQCVDIDASGRIININKQNAKDSSDYKANLLGIDNSQGCTLMMNSQLKDKVLSLVYKGYFQGIIYDLVFGLTASIIGNKYNLCTPLMLYRHHDQNVVAKSNISGRSFIQRVEEKNTFPGFIPDSRIEFMQIFKDAFKDEILCPEIANVINRITEIHNSKNYISRLFLILKFKEYSISRRISIFIKSLLLKIIKSCL